MWFLLLVFHGASTSPLLHHLMVRRVVRIQREVDPSSCNHESSHGNLVQLSCDNLLLRRSLGCELSVLQTVLGLSWKAWLFRRTCHPVSAKATRDQPRRRRGAWDGNLTRGHLENRIFTAAICDLPFLGNFIILS